MIHGTLRQQVEGLFTKLEKPVLQPLPAGIFPCLHEARRSVTGTAKSSTRGLTTRCPRSMSVVRQAGRLTACIVAKKPDCLGSGCIED
jgi:hypothetical protein